MDGGGAVQHTVKDLKNLDGPTGEDELKKECSTDSFIRGIRDGHRKEDDIKKDRVADSADLSSNLQALEIDSEKHDSHGYDKLQTSSEKYMDIMRGNSGPMASAEFSGDIFTVFPQNTQDELLEQDNQLHFHNVFLPPLSPGSPLAIPPVQGFLPYSFSGVQYPCNPVMDYQYLVPPVYGSLPSGLQYPIQGNNGYVFGSHIYQYPPQIASYQPSLNGGQFITSPQGLPLIMLDAPDPSQSGLILTDGFANGYPGSLLTIPTGIFPEMGGIQVFPQSQSLRASAPAWIEPNTNEIDNKETGGHMNSDQANTSCEMASKDISSNSAAAVSVTSVDIDRAAETQEGCEPVNKSVVPSDPGGLKGTGPLLSSHAKNILNCGEQFNSSEFITEYDDAKHFIIKSYSEENVLKSIQYGVWASTPNGNKKLDEAYQDAQQRIASGSSSSCPVFLFFSVNGSRQFCGVAQMIGPVNHSKTMDFWEQHKWSGSFPVKWHIIKDLPNSQLRRIILENNENKPVTNSRDTQEVPLQQGLEMLAIFKHYPVRSLILDQLSWFLQKPAVQDVKLHHWSPLSFPRIGEHPPRDELTGSSSPKMAPKVGLNASSAFRATKSNPAATIQVHATSLVSSSSNDLENKEMVTGTSMTETKVQSEPRGALKENKSCGSKRPKDKKTLESVSEGSYPLSPPS